MGNNFSGIEENLHICRYMIFWFAKSAYMWIPIREFLIRLTFTNKIHQKLVPNKKKVHSTSKLSDLHFLQFFKINYRDRFKRTFFYRHWNTNLFKDTKVFQTYCSFNWGFLNWVPSLTMQLFFSFCKSLSILNRSAWSVG